MYILCIYSILHILYSTFFTCYILHNHMCLLSTLPAGEGAENGLNFTIVRPFNWIGPRMDFIPGIDGPADGVPRVLACFSTVPLYSPTLLTILTFTPDEGGWRWRDVKTINPKHDSKPQPRSLGLRAVSAFVFEGVGGWGGGGFRT